MMKASTKYSYKIEENFVKTCKIKYKKNSEVVINL